LLIYRLTLKQTLEMILKDERVLDYAMRLTEIKMPTATGLMLSVSN